MADKVQDFAEYRIRQIEIAEAKYYESLIATLDKIEKEVVSLAGRTLPTDDLERLYDLKIAVSMQPKIRAILEKEYLAWSDTVVREGFTKQAKRIERAFKGIGNIPREFQQLTNADLTLITNLKRQSFTQFKDVSNTLNKEIDKEIARAVVDNDEKLSQIFDEIDSNAETGQFTQDEPVQEDQDVEEEEV